MDWNNTNPSGWRRLRIVSVIAGLEHIGDKFYRVEYDWFKRRRALALAKGCSSLFFTEFSR
jgi:hypothetical protein